MPVILTQRQIKMWVFSMMLTLATRGTIHVFLKFTFNLNVFNFRSRSVIISFFYIAVLYVAFCPFKFYETAPINFVMVFFTKNS